MAFSYLRELLIAGLLLLLQFLYRQFKSRSSKSNPVLPTDWPLIGMLPSLAANIHDFHGYATALFAASGPGPSFEVRGPAATGMRFFCTCDPANVRHIFVSNFGNYPKGEEFGSFFDAMGGSFFNADGESWRRQRARVQRLMASPRLLALMAASCRDKVENGLLPALARRGEGSAPFDLQELFARFAFDMTAMAVFGVDPGLLSVDMSPPMHVPDAMDAVMEVGFFRHTVPVPCWKLMRRLGVGSERRLAAAQPLLRRFVADMIERRRTGGDAVDSDIASSYIGDPEYTGDDGEPNGFLHATLINYMFAGRDTVGTTLAWLFHSLATHPRVVAGIRRELAPVAAAASRKSTGAGSGMVVFETEETRPLVYLQAALLESMRLHPPGPIERKAALADDVLPSGHGVRAGKTVLVSVYSMGRMKRVWGEDCAVYRPERWLVVSDDGGATTLRQVAAHRFMAFNAGPRSCLGKDVSLAQMKSVAAAVLWNFDVEEAVPPGHAVEPKLSVVLQMRHGLPVTATRRRP